MTQFVNVVVSQGVVDLWGVTDSSEVKRAIRVAAENAPGVREVRDHVGILPSNGTGHHGGRVMRRGQRQSLVNPYSTGSGGFVRSR